MRSCGAGLRVHETTVRGGSPRSKVEVRAVGVTPPGDHLRIDRDHHHALGAAGIVITVGGGSPRVDGEDVFRLRFPCHVRGEQKLRVVALRTRAFQQTDAEIMARSSSRTRSNVG